MLSNSMGEVSCAYLTVYFLTDLLVVHFTFTEINKPPENEMGKKA